MRNKPLFIFGILALVFAFVLRAFDQRPSAIVLLIMCAADLTFVFWTQPESSYYSGKYRRANIWIDTVSVWVGAIFTAIVDNWGGTVAIITPALSVPVMIHQSRKK